MKIPINIPDIGKEEIREVTAVLSEKSLTSSSFDGGKRVQQFEKLLSKFVKSKFAVAVNSGTAALQASLYAIGIKPGDEVITVAAGFPTTVAPIVQVGAVPVFIDADPITGNADCDDGFNSFCFEGSCGQCNPETNDGCFEFAPFCTVQAFGATCVGCRDSGDCNDPR